MPALNKKKSKDNTQKVIYMHPKISAKRSDRFHEQGTWLHSNKALNTGNTPESKSMLGYAARTLRVKIC